MDDKTQSTEEQAPEDENYFISLSDLMTGIVFIFVILLCAFALDYQRAHAEAEKTLKEARGETEQAIKDAHDARNRDGKSGTASTQLVKADPQISPLASYLQKRGQAYHDALHAFVARVQSHGMRIEIDDDLGIVRLPEKMLFNSGEAKLQDAAKVALPDLAEALDALLANATAPDAQFRFEAVFVEGHTDDVNISNGAFRDNWYLSTARANVTFHELVRTRKQLEDYRNPAGVPLLSVSGYGPNRPVDRAKSAEARARNRRIDIRFLLAPPSAEEIKVLDQQIKQLKAR
jgi:flagellar motor protein MotB